MASPFVGKDGSRHTNHDSMKRANARFGARQPEAAGNGYGEASGAGAGMEEQEGAQDGSQMAAEHGPANHLEIEHDHEAGHHSVHASHPDGHSHTTEHGSADEAHQYAADCAGVGSGGGM